MVSVVFAVGDRMQARTSGFVPEGTMGSIQHVLRNVPKMYYVQFEGYDHPHLMHARDLDCVDDTPDRERATAGG